MSDYHYLENGLLIGLAQVRPSAMVQDPAGALRLVAAKWGNAVCVWPDPDAGNYVVLYVKFHTTIRRFNTEARRIICHHPPPPGELTGPVRAAAPDAAGRNLKLERVNTNDDGSRRVFVGYCPACATVWWASTEALAPAQVSEYIDALCKTSEAEQKDD
jgi:hypothetical protein